MGGKQSPILNSNKLKLGFFSPNCSGGMSVTKVPERWVNSWDNNIRLAQLADEAGIEFLLPIARTLEPAFVEGLIETQQAASLRQGAQSDTRAHAGTEIRLVPEALPALYHSRAGIVASGTATVEAAIMGTPFVMVYRVSPLTYALGKPRVKVAHFAMVNLIAGEQVVPELVQSKFTSANIVAELGKIIPDGEPRTRMIQGLAAVREKLRHGSDGEHPSEKAAAVIAGLLW